MNQHGVQQGYLIQALTTYSFGPSGFTTSINWVFYDALTGKWLFNMTDVPSGFGPGWFGGYGSGAIGTTAKFLVYHPWKRLVILLDFSCSTNKSISQEEQVPRSDCISIPTYRQRAYPWLITFYGTLQWQQYPQAHLYR